MESIISQVITEWGTFGLMIFLIGYFVYDSWKTQKTHKDNNAKAIVAVQKVADKMDNFDMIISLVNDKVYICNFTSKEEK